MELKKFTLTGWETKNFKDGKIVKLVLDYEGSSVVQAIIFEPLSGEFLQSKYCREGVKLGVALGANESGDFIVRAYGSPEPYTPPPLNAAFRSTITGPTTENYTENGRGYVRATKERRREIDGQMAASGAKKTTWKTAAGNTAYEYRFEPELDEEISAEEKIDCLPTPEVMAKARVNLLGIPGMERFLKQKTELWQAYPEVFDPDKVPEWRERELAEMKQKRQQRAESQSVFWSNQAKNGGTRI